MASIGKLMKQAAKMQRQMQEAQAQMADKEGEAASGGGAVEDMVLGAVNQALEQGREIQASEMGKLTGGRGGMGLPGL